VHFEAKEKGNPLNIDFFHICNFSLGRSFSLLDAQAKESNCATA
jgi:hypothetical protein